MLAIMTTPSTCTPAELLANLPGILGFYPRESVVFAAFEATATPHRFLLGPVLRIDVDDMSLLPEVAGSLGHIGHDLLLAFLITDGPKTATESVVDQLFSAAEEGIIDIDACWLTREILTGEPFRLAFGPAPAELTHLKATSGAWEHGHIASITDSAAIKPLLRTGNLPELHRSEAFDHYNRFNPHFDNREITALEDFAARHAADLVRRINREAAQGSGETMSTVITDFHHLLSEIRDTAGTVAEVMNDEEVLVTTAVYLSDSLLRDAVMGAAPDHHQAAMDLSLAVARTFRHHPGQRPVRPRDCRGGRRPVHAGDPGPQCGPAGGPRPHSQLPAPRWGPARRIPADARGHRPRQRDRRGEIPCARPGKRSRRTRGTARRGGGLTPAWE